MQDFYEAWAHKIWIHGRQQETKEVRSNKNAVEQAFRDANAALKTALVEDTAIIVADMARRISAVTLLLIGTDEEKGLFERLRSLIAFPGQIAAFDEKVWSYDTKSSGLVKVVPAKKTVGVWFFSGAVRLDSGLPYMIFCRAWTERPVLDQHVATLQIIQEQIAIVKAMQTTRKIETISVWDAYYPTLAAVQWLREQQAPYIFSVSKDRFGSIVGTVERFVQKTGEDRFKKS